jgi:hypothetical protein
MYTFSRQGEQYVKWMMEKKPIEEASYFQIMSDASTYLPDDLKMNVTSSVLMREGMRYKGSNRSLQTLGVLAQALPSLAKNLAETKAHLAEVKNERDRLEEKRRCLLETVRDQESKIEDLENLKRVLKRELEEKVQQMDQFVLKVAYSLTLLAQIEHEYTAAWSIINEIKKGIIRDLAQPLFMINAKGASQLVELIYRRQDSAIRMAEEHLDRAKQLQEMRKNVAELSN